MKILELLQPNLNKQLDEVLPVVGALGAAALRGLGGAALRGLGGAVGTAARAVSGVNNATKMLKTANSLNDLVGKDPQQTAQDNKLKSTLSKLKNTLSVAGGPPIDVNRTSQTLTNPVDPSKPDPNTSKNLQPLIPALSQALQHPQSADLIAQAIQTGVKTDIQQQAKAEQEKAKQIAQNVKASA